MKHMPASELVEWAAYYEMDPFGEWRGDYRMAVQVCQIANVYRDHDKHPEPFTVNEFMPQFGAATEETKTPTDMLSIVVALNAAFGGVDLR